MTTTVLEIRLDNRIDAELEPGVGRASPARRRDTTRGPGEPFGNDVVPVFSTSTSSANVPSRNEALIALVDGELYKRSRAVVPLPARARRGARRRTGRRSPGRERARRRDAGRTSRLPGRARHGRRPDGGGLRRPRSSGTELQDDYDATVLAAGATGLSVLLHRVAPRLAPRGPGRRPGDEAHARPRGRSRRPTSAAGSRSRGATRSRSRPRPSTRCSTGSSARSRSNGGSSTMPGTSSGRR